MLFLWELFHPQPHLRGQTSQSHRSDQGKQQENDPRPIFRYHLSNAPSKYIKISSIITKAVSISTPKHKQLKTKTANYLNSQA